MIQNSIPSHGQLRDGLYRSLRRTGSSWNMPAPPAIRILKEATCSRGRSTARDETARRSQRQHLHGKPKSKLKTDTQRCQISRGSCLYFEGRISVQGCFGTAQSKDSFWQIRIQLQCAAILEERSR